MGEVVGQAKAAYEGMVSTPSGMDAIGVTANTPSMIDGVLTKAAAWEPLLEKIKLYTEIVDKIAEVV
jgi:hypothetical protein